MNYKKYLIFPLSLAIIVFGNILLQISFQRNSLDNQPINSYSPTSTDALDYLQRAEILAKDSDFVKAFKDGYRMPGYPLFLVVFYYLFDQPLLAVRYTQIVLSSLVILFFCFSVFNILNSKHKLTFAGFGALIISLWLPFYYFSPIIIAESCSIFLLSLLIFVISSFAHTKSIFIAYSSPIFLALLIYLKPNHILMLIPILIFLRLNKLKLVHLAGITLTLIVLLTPWSLFTSIINSEIIPLSTTSGLNLYLGTGVKTDIENSTGAGALSVIIAEKLKLRDESVIMEVDKNVESMSLAASNKYFTKVSVEIWKSRPIKTSIYAFSKIFHTFGFSFRGVRDFVLVIFFLFSIVFSLYLWSSSAYREWCAFFFVIFLVVSLQAFIFLPNQRFKTVFFDLPAMLMVIIGMSRLFETVILKLYARKRLRNGG